MKGIFGFGKKKEANSVSSVAPDVGGPKSPEGDLEQAPNPNGPYPSGIWVPKKNGSRFLKKFAIGTAVIAIVGGILYVSYKGAVNTSNFFKDFKTMKSDVSSIKTTLDSDVMPAVKKINTNAASAAKGTKGIIFRLDKGIIPQLKHIGLSTKEINEVVKRLEERGVKIDRTEKIQIDVNMIKEKSAATWYNPLTWLKKKKVTEKAGNGSVNYTINTTETVSSAPVAVSKEPQLLQLKSDVPELYKFQMEKPVTIEDIGPKIKIGILSPPSTAQALNKMPKKIIKMKKPYQNKIPAKK